ncbi:MAG: hypothetical protein OXH50_14730 [Gemmatimonadetes bacterium]|nr:hypothetical protein [Gemmatimonadota bacterium]
MARSTTVRVFIDANTALHFKRPDQIDWRTLANAIEVVLVAAPVLLRELEEQKIINGSSKLRERAADYIRWLHQFVRHPDTEVRAGVRWSFLPEEPQLDFTAERLSQTIADDHLIASVLDYTRQSDVSVLVATADLGLEVKLRSRAIGVLELLDDLRLPAEPDPVELENRNLKRQIARLEARMPKLSVVFEGGAQHHALSLRDPTTNSVTSLDQIRADNPLMYGTQAVARRQDRVGAGIVDIHRLAQRFGVTAEQADRYNEELEQYFSQYQHYLDDHAAWREALSLHHLVKLVIANDGTAPASNIDLDLFFPDGTRPVDEGDIPKEPKAPKAPRRPQRIMDIRSFSGFDHLPSLFPPTLHDKIAPYDDGKPIVGEDGNSVRIGYSTLKHGLSVTSDGLLFRFADATTVRAFSVEFRLSANEPLDAVEGQLHFRIDNTEA